ncbi:PaaI family thioesterase [Pinisolibacter sp.]|uniref:PaaI family thioesterase n=1 Tax=Pinisolibacter sp. TaxID=2172024 RepID=UPI002FDE0E84
MTDQKTTYPPLAGFAAHLGLAIVGWTEEGPELALDVGPHHLNRNGAVHGGVVLSMLDSVCSLAGVRLVDGRLTGRVVVVQLSTNFVAPVRDGRLLARSRIRGGGAKTIHVEGEVVDEAGATIAMAAGVVRRIRDEIDGVVHTGDDA